ncbi:hypothetical protein BSF38_03180 [Paludisphaera borealis]|uniref:Uncharacterized protein n=1 Tax=Paludisphaera borealis TaxID=1387353 RepID=A0A1U7CRU0_9BACT|nr:hypothetical protein BSF38_03180 [Paludisphaera borealis]
MRGVTRQAISKLIRQGRLRTFEIGGHVLVSRSEILDFRGGAAGRPELGEDRALERIVRLLDASPPETRLQVFQRLRSEFPIHPLEAQLGTPAEVVLEAIARAGPLTLRGIRGVLAESAFEVYIVKELEGWSSHAALGDPPYDYLLEDVTGPVKVQVKLQRMKAGRPMTAWEGYRRFSPDRLVVETQRTRGGKDSSGGDTRPYRFGEFDILAVATEPSTRRWDSFMYTVADWLIPRTESPGQLLKFQPVAIVPDDDWTDDFETCVAWFRSGVKKTIGGRIDGDPTSG